MVRCFVVEDFGDRDPRYSEADLADDKAMTRAAEAKVLSALHAEQIWTDDCVYRLSLTNGETGTRVDVTVVACVKSDPPLPEP